MPALYRRRAANVFAPSGRVAPVDRAGFAGSASLLLAAAVALLLGGCASSKHLYYWGSYQPSVYAYLAEEGPGDIGAQIAALEEDFQKARSRDAQLPPGFHAHLGLLYDKLGQGEQARQQFETERTLYPESAPFMDYLLSGAARARKADGTESVSPGGPPPKTGSSSGSALPAASSDHPSLVSPNAKPANTK